jgi:hypothetical protein
MLPQRKLNKGQLLTLSSGLFVFILLLLILLFGRKLFSNKQSAEKMLVGPTNPEWLYTHGP